MRIPADSTSVSADAFYQMREVRGDILDEEVIVGCSKIVVLARRGRLMGSPRVPRAVRHSPGDDVVFMYPVFSLNLIFLM